MPRVCTICGDPRADEIDRQCRIESNIERIAKEFSISYPALYRHIQGNHHIRAVTAIPTSAELATSEDILREITEHHKEAIRLKELAESKGDLKTALLGLEKALKCLDLITKIQGLVREQTINVNTQVNIASSPEWITLRTLILTRLEPFPEARDAVFEALP
jgi:hypothetical protein